MSKWGHIPVLAQTIAQLGLSKWASASPAQTFRIVDVTVGAGGHSEALLKQIRLLDPNQTRRVHLIGLDRDSSALSIAASRLESYRSDTVEVDFVLGRFGQLRDVLASRLNKKHSDIASTEPFIDLVVADLGVSSMQLDNAARGFSIRNPGLLDMRMDYDMQDNQDSLLRTPEGKNGESETDAPDKSSSKGVKELLEASVSAMELVQYADESTLRNIIETYGEEQNGRRIAAAIVSERERHRRAGKGGPALQTTEELAYLVERTIPWVAHNRASKMSNRPGSRYIHPATKTFQALRIAVNQELPQLKDLLTTEIPAAMRIGGCFMVLAYHSLEDRIVKHTMRSFSDKGWESLSPIIYPSKEEIAQNPRARSALLRSYHRKGLETVPIPDNKS